MMTAVGWDFGFIVMLFVWLLQHPSVICFQQHQSPILLRIDDGLPNISNAALIGTFPTRYPTAAPTQCNFFPATQLAALKDIYDRTDGENWEYGKAQFNEAQWNFSQPNPNPCAQNWAFINCFQCNVVDLLILNAHMVGTLPDNFGNFTNLSELEIVGSPKLRGKIPSSICSLKYVQLLQLSENALSGTIPSCIGQLKYMRDIILNQNALTGTIPIELMGLTGLNRIELKFNNLTGTIPNEIGNLTNLRELLLDSNELSGTIPQNLGLCYQLIELTMYKNKIRGLLPQQGIFWPNLKILYLDGNELTGPLPDWLETLQTVRSLNLEVNRFTGTIPASLGQLPSLEYINLKLNRFTGTIPSTLIQGLVQYLDVGNNRLTGTLPDVTSSCALNFFFANSNFLSGSIPSNYANMSLIEFFEIYENAFTGTIPQTLFNNADVSFIEFQNNYFTGSIPESFGAFRRLDTLKLNNNLLSSTIPAEWDTIEMTTFYLQENFLTGSIPPTIATRWNKIQFVYLSQNFITGAIPFSFEYKYLLSAFLANSNFLSGPIPTGLAVRHLSCLDLSANILTGSVPMTLFTNTSLQTLVLAGNCLSLTFSEEICSLKTTLETLILDSIQSAVSCQNLLFPSLSHTFDTYAGVQSVFGEIPVCLFEEFEVLTALYISGNSMTGTLPININRITSSLTNLSMTHNFLSGTLPLAFQQHANWTYLDLSFNKLQGTLVDDFMVANLSTSEIYLNLNQFSGNVPSTFIELENINVLTGNIFDCQKDRSDLPRHDQDYRGFQCGSDAVNNAIYLWLIVLLVIVIIIGVFVILHWSSCCEAIISPWRLYQLYEESYTELMIVSQTRNFYGIQELSVTLMIVRRFLLNCFLVICCLCLPMYVLLSQWFGTVKPGYAWEASIGNKTGIIASTVILVILSLVLGILWKSKNELETCMESTRRLPNNRPKITFYDILKKAINLEWKQILFICLFVCFDIVIVMVVSVGYVEATSPLNTSYTFVTKQLISLAASLFKTLWTIIVILSAKRYKSIQWKKQATALNNTSSNNPTDAVRVKESYQLLPLLLFFNNIIVPCFALTIYNENCLYDAFVSSPDTVSRYSFFFYSIERIDTAILSVGIYVSEEVVSPQPFQYRYRCSSTLLMVFASVVIYRYIVIAFILPLIFMTFKMIERWMHNTDKESNHLFGRLSLSCLPPLWRINEWSNLEMIDRVFDVNTFSLSLFGDISILMVFGAVFPLIAIVGICATGTTITLYRLLLGRWFLIVKQNVNPDDPLYAKLLSIINNDVRGFQTRCMTAFNQLLWLVPPIWAVFLFDILGNTLGMQSALIIFVVCGIVLSCLFKCFDKFLTHQTNSKKSPNSEFELSASLSFVVNDAKPLPTQAAMCTNTLSSSSLDSDCVDNPMLK